MSTPSCPVQCMLCKPGDLLDGGDNLVDGTCTKWCSPYRYCGSSDTYRTTQTDGTRQQSIDCRGCRESGQYHPFVCEKLSHCAAEASSFRAAGNDDKNYFNKEIVVLVKSDRSSKAAGQRQVIRETWGHSKRVSIYFFIGDFDCPVPMAQRPNWWMCGTSLSREAISRNASRKARSINLHEQSLLLREANLFGDIVMLPMIDVYHNTARKFKLMMAWATKRFPNANWFMHTDHDTFVDTFQLPTLTEWADAEVARHGKRYAVVANSFQVGAPNMATNSKNYELISGVKIYHPFPFGAVWMVNQPLARWISANGALLREYSGEDNSIGLWIHKYIQGDTILVNAPDLLGVDGDCFNHTRVATGHNIGASHLKICNAARALPCTIEKKRQQGRSPAKLQHHSLPEFSAAEFARTNTSICDGLFCVNIIAPAPIALNVEWLDTLCVVNKDEAVERPHSKPILGPFHKWKQLNISNTKVGDESPKTYVKSLHDATGHSGSFEETSALLLAKIRCGHPFSLSRFGDGELSVLSGDKYYNALHREWSFNMSNKSEKDLDTSRTLKRYLEDSFYLAAEYEDMYIGLPLYFCREATFFKYLHHQNIVGGGGNRGLIDKYVDYFSTSSLPTVPNVQVMHSWQWGNLNYPRLIKMLHILAKKGTRCVVVCGEHLREGILSRKPEWLHAALLIPGTAGFQWLLGGLVSIVESAESLARSLKNTVFLFSAGPISNVLIPAMTRANKANTYIDIGGALTFELAGIRSRDFHPTAENSFVYARAGGALQNKQDCTQTRWSVTGVPRL